jgi:hypothetical protein
MVYLSLSPRLRTLVQLFLTSECELFAHRTGKHSPAIPPCSRRGTNKQMTGADLADIMEISMIEVVNHPALRSEEYAQCIA